MSGRRSKAIRRRARSVSPEQRRAAIKFAKRYHRRGASGVQRPVGYMPCVQLWPGVRTLQEAVGTLGGWLEAAEVALAHDAIRKLRGQRKAERRAVRR